MTKEEAIAFKNEARNYKFYRKHIPFLEDKIKEVEYKMSGLKAVQYEEHAHSTNPSEKRDKYYQLMDKKDELINKISEYKKRMETIENISIQIRKRSEMDYVLFRSVIIDGKSATKVGSELGFTHTSVFKRIDNALGKIKTLLN